MAIMSNKLTVDSPDTGVQLCNIYTIEEDGTPIGGSCLEVINNGVKGYIGLYPSPTEKYPTPLKVLKDGVEYYVQTQVINTYTVTLIANPYAEIVLKDANDEIIGSTIPGGNDWVGEVVAKSTVTISITPIPGYSFEYITVE